MNTEHYISLFLSQLHDRLNIWNDAEQEYDQTPCSADSHIRQLFTIRTEKQPHVSNNSDRVYMVIVAACLLFNKFVPQS